MSVSVNVSVTLDVLQSDGTAIGRPVRRLYACSLQRALQRVQRRATRTTIEGDSRTQGQRIRKDVMSAPNYQPPVASSHVARWIYAPPSETARGGDRARGVAISTGSRSHERDNALTQVFVPDRG